MEFLCFTNGRNQVEIVKIIEGDLHEIDRLTSKYLDSDAIRKKYRKEFALFQKKYPDAKNGAVRIFGESVKNENGLRVLYKKHKVVFNHIIRDKNFLRWFARAELNKPRSNRILSDIYILRGITEFHLELTRINQYLASIKKRDRAEDGKTGGGKRYYHFMRILLNRYEDYRKEFNKPSLDDIWKEYLKSFQDIKLDKTPKCGTITTSEQKVAETIQLPLIFDEEIDPDQAMYDSEVIYGEPLYDFFSSDYFEQGYSTIFKNDKLMLIGELSKTGDLDEIKPFTEVCDICYNGETLVSTVDRFSHDELKDFNTSKFTILYAEEYTIELRNLLILATENESEIVVITNDRVVANSIMKKHPNIRMIVDDENDNHLRAKKDLVAFFIEQYNKEYRKQK